MHKRYSYRHIYPKWLTAHSTYTFINMCVSRKLKLQHWQQSVPVWCTKDSICGQAVWFQHCAMTNITTIQWICVLLHFPKHEFTDCFVRCARWLVYGVYSVCRIWSLNRLLDSYQFQLTSIISVDLTQFSGCKLNTVLLVVSHLSV